MIKNENNNEDNKNDINENNEYVDFKACQKMN